MEKEPLPLEIAAALLGKRQKDKDAEKVWKLTHPMKRTKKPDPKRQIYILPEEFTGGDFRRAKKLIKNRPT